MATGGKKQAEEFLKLNMMESEWQDFFQGNDRIFEALKKSVQKMKQNKLDFIPGEKDIFAAFRHCPLKTLKVIIIGHDPIPYQCLATGLAFSFPESTKEGDCTGTGQSVQKVHTAIRSALELVGSKVEIPSEENTSCCHKDWARNGVLLLNSVLTVSPMGNEQRTKHKDIWLEFTKVLMEELLMRKKNIAVLFWGSHAEEIFRHLKENLKEHAFENKTEKGNKYIAVKYTGKNEGYSGKLEFFPGHHPVYPSSRNRFLKQAGFAFTRIIQQYGENLFRLRDVTVQADSSASGSTEDAPGSTEDDLSNQMGSLLL